MSYLVNLPSNDLEQFRFIISVCSLVVVGSTSEDFMSDIDTDCTIQYKHKDKKTRNARMKGF